MSFTYDVELSQSRDQVRFLIQDNQESRALFQDEEIDWIITQEMNVYMAGARLCDILVNKSGGVKSKAISEFIIVYNVEFYKYLGNSLRARGLTYQSGYAGGISIADKIAQQNDSDWVPASIPRGLGDNPGAPKPTAPSTNPLNTI